MTTDDASDPRVVPQAHEQESPNEEANENDDESGETPDKPDDEDHEMEGDASRARHSSDVELKPRRNAPKQKKTCS